MKLKNTEKKYGAIAVTFHWLIALLIIGQLTGGLIMVELPLSSQKVQLYGFHKDFGVIILALALLRILWRLMNVVPPQESHIPQWQKMAAAATHYSLYTAIIVMPITGWVMSSADGFPVSFFGLFTMPDLVSPNKELAAYLLFAHKWIGFGLIGLITLHVAATIQHFVVHKENLLNRMWY